MACKTPLLPCPLPHPEESAEPRTHVKRAASTTLNNRRKHRKNKVESVSAETLIKLQKRIVSVMCSRGVKCTKRSVVEAMKTHDSRNVDKARCVVSDNTIRKVLGHKHVNANSVRKLQRWCHEEEEQLLHHATEKRAATDMSADDSEHETLLDTTKRARPIASAVPDSAPALRAASTLSDQLIDQICLPGTFKPPACALSAQCQNTVYNVYVHFRDGQLRLQDSVGDVIVYVT